MSNISDGNVNNSESDGQCERLAASAIGGGKKKGRAWREFAKAKEEAAVREGDAAVSGGDD